MSLAFILMLLGILAGFLAFAPGMLGEQRIEAFGQRVNRWADGARHSFARSGQAAVGGMLTLVVSLFLGLVFAFGETGLLPPWGSERVVDEYFDAFSTFLKYAGFLLGGLLGLSMAVAVIFFFLWLAARLLAVIPVTPRSVAIVAFLATVAICVAGYETAP